MSRQLTDQITAAVIQLTSGNQRDANLAKAESLLAQAAAAGATLALLPENFSFMGSDDAQKRAVVENEEDSEVLQFLQQQAERHSMLILGGTTPLAAPEAAVRNAMAAVQPDGSIAAIYDKMHLFDVNLPDEQYLESELIKAGGSPASVASGPWKIGMSICYDLRFPELYRHYSSEGCNILAVPAAFTVPTGKAHWKTLLRARAIENQCYVLAAGQSGTHPGGRRTWGHSMIIDPWGEVIARIKTDEGLAIAQLRLEFVDQVRSRMPALQHRRM